MLGGGSDTSVMWCPCPLTLMPWSLPQPCRVTHAQHTPEAAAATAAAAAALSGIGNPCGNGLSGGGGGGGLAGGDNGGVHSVRLYHPAPQPQHLADYYSHSFHEHVTSPVSVSEGSQCPLVQQCLRVVWCVRLFER
jgi:hypothetical protein